MSTSPSGLPAPSQHAFTDRIVRTFLDSNLSLILLVLAVVLGAAALVLTPREEDPQIVVPLADVLVRFPGHSAAEVEQLVATPLEKILYQIDGVEYVYSMSRPDEAVITVRFYVGEDRERSLVKLYKKIDENVDIAPPGVTGWVVKPVEIDDVPIVTLALTGKTLTAAAAPTPLPPREGAGGGAKPPTATTCPTPATPTFASSTTTADEYTLRRVAEECVERLAAVKNVSRAYVIGGRPRVAQLYLDPDRMSAHGATPLSIQQALAAANVLVQAGDFSRNDTVYRVDAGKSLAHVDELKTLVIGVWGENPVFLKDVAEIRDGPAEATSYVRHGWGPGRGFTHRTGFPGTAVSGDEFDTAVTNATAHVSAEPTPLPPGEGVGGGSEPPTATTSPAVTLALAKKKGANAVWVAEDILRTAADLQRDVIPDDLQLVITRNYGLTADDKVNELVEALAVAIFIVIALLTLGLGWREALIVAVAVPVVFGLTLAVNLLLGYTINRVTLFALILSLGLLVDDPIVDVENIARHFALRKKATRHIVLEAVAEIRPPLITATLAVIVSFLPMFFITGMMGPYMRPMALNVPVTMIMSMVVAFTITPWLTYHVLKRHYGKHQGNEGARDQGIKAGPEPSHETEDLETLRKSALYRAFYPLMAPLLHSRRAAWLFLGVMALLMVGAAGLAAIRAVPLKMLPFDNKNELSLVLDFDEGTSLERSDAAVRDFEAYLAGVPEVTDFTSYVGLASPMDFNGLVRHYYLRSGANVAEIRLNLVGKKNRASQSHALGLHLRDDLTALAQRHQATLKIVEVPPGPPVIATLTAEVRGRPDHTYADLMAAAKTVRARLEREPGVVDVDDTIEAHQTRLVFVTDKEKAALSGVTTADIASTLRIALGGESAGLLHVDGERNPLQIELRLPEALRSSRLDLTRLQVQGRRSAAGATPPGSGAGDRLIPLAELGRWEEQTVDQTIYHKNLERIAYVFAETAGRTPAECVVDIQADQRMLGSGAEASSHAIVAPTSPAAPTAQAAPTPLPLREGAGGGSEHSNRGAPTPRPVAGRTFLTSGGDILWSVPAGIRVNFAGEGEWQITLDVFRDLGLAFAAALVGIYILLVAQMDSFVIPLVVMMAIPLTVIGIMPGFWLLNLFAHPVGPYADPVLFTATGMIGMIALSGIVTRDSIILVDFIHLSLKRGRSLFDAIMESRVVRLRPILLTTGAAMLGAAPITIDPIFSGLAWALIFGLFASTVFTLFVIPVVYWLLYANKPGHGLPMVNENE
jgi:multidrug efflux pump subunit AcrB